MLRNFKWYRRATGGEWLRCKYEGPYISPGSMPIMNGSIYMDWFKTGTNRYEQFKEDIIEILEVEKYL